MPFKVYPSFLGRKLLQLQQAPSYSYQAKPKEASSLCYRGSRDQPLLKQPLAISISSPAKGKHSLKLAQPTQLLQPPSYSYQAKPREASPLCYRGSRDKPLLKPLFTIFSFLLAKGKSSLKPLQPTQLLQPSFLSLSYKTKSQETSFLSFKTLKDVPTLKKKTTFAIFRGILA
jgi:hypothetical protein